MPRRECCGAWTDQPHRSTCREPLRPARAEDVERARRAEAPSVRVAADIAAGRVEHLSEPFRSMPRSIPSNPDFKREPPLVSIHITVANDQRCSGCGGADCNPHGSVCGWRPTPTEDLKPEQIAEAFRRAEMGPVEPAASAAATERLQRLRRLIDSGQLTVASANPATDPRRRMGNAEFVAGVDFQRHGAILAGLDFGHAPTVGIDSALAEQIREALRRGAKVTICGEAVTSETIHACKGTTARFDVERIAGDWTIIDTETKAGMVIAFCPFCGDKLATEGA